MILRNTALSLLAMLLMGESVAAKDWDFPTLGFSITTPSGWHVVDDATFVENRERVDAGTLNDEIRAAEIPAVSVTRFPPSHDDLNARLSVTVRVLDQANVRAMDLAEALIPPLRAAFPDFEVAEGPRQIVVGGVDASFTRVRYTLLVDGSESYPVESLFWLVPQDRRVLIVGAGLRQDQDADTRTAIDRSVESIRFH